MYLLLIGFACVGEVGPIGAPGPSGAPGSVGQIGPTGRQGFPGAAHGVVWVDANEVEVGSIERFAFYDAENRRAEKGFLLFSQLVYTDEQGIKWPISPTTGQLQRDLPVIEEDKAFFLQRTCLERGKLYYPVTSGFAFRVNDTWYVTPKGRTATNRRPLSFLDKGVCREIVIFSPVSVVPCRQFGDRNASIGFIPNPATSGTALTAQKLIETLRCTMPRQF